MASFALSGQLTTPLGNVAVSLAVPINADGVGDVSTVLLGSGGYTAFAVPTWAVGVAIVPTSTNTHTLLLKLNSGDTGRNISPISPSVIALDNNNLPADVYLESSGTDTTNTTVAFF